MRNVSILFFVLFSLSSFAQSWGAKLENAQFENRVNNIAAYSSEVKIVTGEHFTTDDFEAILKRCLFKEGVFRLDISEDKSTITVYFLEWIDQWTINWLFTEASANLENKLRIGQKTAFSF